MADTIAERALWVKSAYLLSKTGNGGTIPGGEGANMDGGVQAWGASKGGVSALALTAVAALIWRHGRRTNLERHFLTVEECESICAAVAGGRRVWMVPLGPETS